MRVVRTLVLAVLAAAALVVVAEGALSLFLGRSLRALLPERAEPRDELALEREQAIAARATEGPLRVAEDPLVSYTLKLSTALTLAENGVTMELHTDDTGMRGRAAPAPADALRIAVLGDSVAFGYGLADGDVLAAQLERLLAAALPGRAVACDTVAIPSWNARNAWRFLLDHLASLRPAIVVYMPVPNDLEDAYGVNEAGQRRAGADPAAPLPLLPVHANLGIVGLRMERARARGEPEPRLGVEVLASGVGPTSRARIADVARTIAGGAARLARAGIRTALAFYEESDFERALVAELARQGADLPRIPLLTRLRDEDTLRTNPHPSAETTVAFAAWTAQSLAELGWLPAEARGGLAGPPARFADRRAPVLSAAEAEERSRARRAEVEDELEARLDPRTLQGMLQVYGGLNADGTIGARAAAVLRRGRELVVELGALAARPDLYPLEVRVLVDERPVGTVVVPAGGKGEARFALEPAQAAAAFEVRLEPLDWAVITVRGRSWVAAAELLALESVP